MFELSIDEKRPVEEDNSQKRAKKQLEDEEKSTIMRTALFRKIIESVAEIVDDVDINITQEGLSIQFMDAMNVTMMNVFLPESTFDMFSEDNPEFLNIKFETEACTADYVIKLQNIGSESYNIPAIEFTAEAEMKSSDFLMMRQSAGNFAEYITVEASDSTINLSQSGEMISSKTKNKAAETGKYNIRVNITEEVSVEISMKYMNCVTKTARYCPNIKLCLGVNEPVFFEFKLKEGGHINYFIAPKMDEE
ncbi:DgyrCDS14602 [Dimorphilus gyrociliatus]|uniref:DNA sliding clamp PCNA n=1 Tax=Dimorphilus gyrociliatus TaxID=2664684 RepID=A0A7I8WE61_9ANNE|nr:DgyrCDS14602 [Dimorphilus gyrociliatus]